MACKEEVIGPPAERKWSERFWGSFTRGKRILPSEEISYSKQENGTHKATKNHTMWAIRAAGDCSNEVGTGRK